MRKFFNEETKEVIEHLQSDIEKGLTSEEFKKRLKRDGYNELAQGSKRTVFQIFITQFKSFMILILIIAAIISGVVGVMSGEGLIDVFVIMGIVILNAVIGTVQEKKAESSLEALQKLSAPKCKVIRDGHVITTDSKNLVVGDIVIIETGDLVPADIRIIESANLKIQESAMTGESLPIEKNSDKIEGDNIPLGDRVNMAFSSGIVTYGHGRGIVVATGMNTEVGKIAGMLQNTQSTETPMSRRLEQLGKVLGLATLAICCIVFVVGILYGHNIISMLMISISLAVAAIPEGLPAISTIVLAMGVQRMVKKNAIVRTLPSVETLGSATIICSDKTGTLTQNKMTVVSLSVAGIEYDDITDKLPLTENGSMLLQTSILCSDAMLSNGKTIGDPTETALLDAGITFQLNKNDLEKKYPRVNEIPFDSDRKLMTTVNQLSDNTLIVNTKGGLDEVLSCCNRIRIGNEDIPITEAHISVIREENEKMAKDALRVLGIAYKHLQENDEISDAKSSTANLECNLTFIGILGMIDPARPEAKEAVATCFKAGIKPVMITGDHKITASAIAKEIGILKQGGKVVTGVELEQMSDDDLFNQVKDIDVYARVAPEHKVRIVNAFQRHGEVVAMTGDGVNDAPALKKADIGAAMGIVGTDVAKDAADIILTDDNFSTIVTAVEEGRRIYDNILKSIQFLLSTNIGEVVLLFITSIANLGMPLLPIHILWINLVTDSLPALALSLDPADDGIMNRKPRSTKTGIFTKGMIWRIAYQGFTFGLISLAAFLIGKNQAVMLNMPENSIENFGQTMAFATLVLAQLVHVRNLHSNTKSAFRLKINHNTKLLGAIFVSLLLMLLVLLIPAMRNVFEFSQLGKQQWITVILLALIPTIIVEIMKMLKFNSSKDEY